MGRRPGDALRAVSRDGIRPITMTTFAAILTLAPLRAFAIGQGSRTLAIAITAGLMLRLPLALPGLIRLTLPSKGGCANCQREKAG